MEPDMNTHKMFERYLYSYLVKRNMRQTAEVFKNEANLQLDPSAALSNAMAAPEEFLLRWWSFSSDFDTYRAWALINETDGLQATSECDVSHEGGSSLSLNQLLVNLSPTGAFNIGSNAISSDGTGECPLIFFPSSNLEVGCELLQLAVQSSHAGELLTSTVRPINVTHANGSNHEQLMMNAPRPELSGFTKETDPMLEILLNTFWLFEQDQPSLFDETIMGEVPNMENLVAYGEENTGVNEFADSPMLLSDDDNSETGDNFANSETSEDFVNSLIITDDDEVSSPSVGIQ